MNTSPNSPTPIYKRLKAVLLTTVELVLNASRKSFSQNALRMSPHHSLASRTILNLEFLDGVLLLLSGNQLVPLTVIVIHKY